MFSSDSGPSRPVNSLSSHSPGLTAPRSSMGSTIAQPSDSSTTEEDREVSHGRVRTRPDLGGKDRAMGFPEKLGGKDTAMGFPEKLGGKDTAMGFPGKLGGKDTAVGFPGKLGGKDTAMGFPGKLGGKDTAVGFPGKLAGKDTAMGFPSKLTEVFNGTREPRTEWGGRKEEVEGTLVIGFNPRLKSSLVPFLASYNYVIRASMDNLFLSVLANEALVMAKHSGSIEELAQYLFQVQKYQQMNSDVIVLSIRHKSSQSYLGVSGHTVKLFSSSTRCAISYDAPDVAAGARNVFSGDYSQADGRPRTVHPKEPPSSFHLSGGRNDQAASVSQTWLFKDIDLSEALRVCLVPILFPDFSVSYKDKDGRQEVVLVDKPSVAAFSFQYVGDKWRKVRHFVNMTRQNRR